MDDNQTTAEDAMIQKEISVLGRLHLIHGDIDYLGNMGAEFEPEITSLMAVLCDPSSIAIDIGANIGLTSVALSDICREGYIVAIEPVPSTFALLKRNLIGAGAGNVSTVNVAVGAERGMVSMYVNEKNLASSFIHHDATDAADIPMTTLDSIVSKLSHSHIDFIKIDVEGFELSVLHGASDTLARFQPIVMLEMNHWCLNIFRRIPLPDFRDALLKIFPVIYAVDGGTFLDFTNSEIAGKIYHDHVIGNKFMNLVAGYDNVKLIEKLSQWRVSPSDQPGTVKADVIPSHHIKKCDSETRLEAILASRSWKWTAPIRQCGRVVRRLLR